MKRAELAAMIDHTLLKPEATFEQTNALVDEAVREGCASVCVNGVMVHRARVRLDGAGEHKVRLCAVASFPLGATTSVARAIEATQLAKAGAEEIDLVPWLPLIIDRQEDALREDLLETTRAVRAVRSSIEVKVIIETAALRAAASDDDEFEAMIACACRASAQSGCDFVKTSTGFHPAGGATVEAVRLMCKHAGPLKVKASGGVRAYDDAVAMIDAGASRLGCSSTLALLDGAE